MSENKIVHEAEVLSEAPSNHALVPVSSDLATLPSYEDSLDAYLKRIAQIPLLTQEDEEEYARRFRDQKDMSAGQYLILSNLRFVVYVAKGFKGYGLPMADLIQEGNMGLMKAVDRYDPDKKVRFISYAVHWIRCDINEYIIKNMRMVRSITSKDRRKLLFALNKHKKSKHGAFTYAEKEQLAEQYGVSIKDIEVVESTLGGSDASLNYENSHGVTGIELLPDANSAPDSIYEDATKMTQHKSLVSNMMSQLNDRQKEIIEARYLSDEKVSLEQLAERYNVSMQRVSQIEKQALEKCRQLGVSLDLTLLDAS